MRPFNVLFVESRLSYAVSGADKWYIRSTRWFCPFLTVSFIVGGLLCGRVQGQTGVISHLGLVDATTRTAISAFTPLRTGVVIPAEEARGLTIRAFLLSLPGSVQLVLSGPLSFQRIDGGAPFTLFGDSAAGFEGRNLPSGSYTITVSTFSGPNASGTLLESRSIPFSVAEPLTASPSPTPSSTPSFAAMSPTATVQSSSTPVLPTISPTATSTSTATPTATTTPAPSSSPVVTPTPAFTVVPGQTVISHLGMLDATTRTTFANLNPLRTGAIVPVVRPGSITIRAFLLVPAPSVRLSITGPLSRVQIENGSPYTLFGETGTTFMGSAFPPGDYQIEVSAFSNPNGEGAVLETRSVSFRVDGGTTPTPTVAQSSTQTPSPVPTASATASDTPTATPSATATNAATAAMTNTAIATVTSTATPTATHTVTATSTATATSTPIATATVAITATTTPVGTAQTATPTPAFVVTPGQTVFSHVGLLDATTRTSVPGLNPLLSGAVIPTTAPSLLTIRAFLVVPAPSVRFVLTGPISRTQIENGSPYTLFGDSGSIFNGVSFPAGDYSLEIAVFANPDATGTILVTRTVTFKVDGIMTPSPTATALGTSTSFATATPTLTATATATSELPTATPRPTVGPIEASSVLMITDPSVVDDPVRTQNRCDPSILPEGQFAAWGFGRLMKEMAGDGNPSSFIENWLLSFGSDQVVNGDPVPARANSHVVLDAWPRLLDGSLDLTRPPFRLLGIAYRPDLRNRNRGQAGEGRLIFGALNSSCEAIDFTVIFEYRLLATNCRDTVEWGTRFFNLMPLRQTAAYNPALQQVTDLFTSRGAIPTNQNGSGINQVRTGERALGADGVWEIREFRLVPDPVAGAGFSTLKTVTVKQTPMDSLNGSTTLADFINGNTAAILLNKHGVPDSLLGGKSRVIAPWNAAGIIDPEARHQFAVATCNGCHSFETGASFMHVKPRAYGAAAELSDFLTGAAMPKVDPVDGTRSHSFADLTRREGDLGVLLATVCADSDPIPLARRRRYGVAVRPTSEGGRMHGGIAAWDGTVGKRKPSRHGGRGIKGRTGAGNNSFYCDPSQLNNPRGPYRGSALRNKSPFKNRYHSGTGSAARSLLSRRGKQCISEYPFVH